MLRFIALAVLLLGFQAAFWYHTRDIKPDMSIVPNVPGRDTVQALSLGDEQFFFRVLALQIQNAGDTFGRFTALYKYDFNKLAHWFRLLDSLDDTSNFIPSLATYYFSQTQNRPDVQYIIDYLIDHSEHRVEEKWWWLVQAIYLAQHKLEDDAQALEIAHKLSGDYAIPLWARQMPAFVHEKRGELDAALVIIQDLLKNADSFSQQEFNFIRIFIEDRLERMGEVAALLEDAQQRIEQPPAESE
jgi:tetratricopeptide (TPR) repeat protein